MTYPGGKGNIYQWLINQIPPHDCFISGFLGNCAIMRHKAPARENIGIDRDPAALALFRDADHIELIQGDALRTLPTLSQITAATTFVYLDPPYLMETRSSQRDLYRYELNTTEEHTQLLTLATSLDCMVMISGYRSSLYDTMLQGWRKKKTKSMTRGGTMATEYVWMNYPEPVELHDYRFLGDDYRERERLKRIQQRWKRRLKNMPRLERLALMEVLHDASRSVERCRPVSS